MNYIEKVVDGCLFTVYECERKETMYYEEKVISGVLCSRTSSYGKFIRFPCENN